MLRLGNELDKPQKTEDSDWTKQRKKQEQTTRWFNGEKKATLQHFSSCAYLLVFLHNFFSFRKIWPRWSDLGM